MWFNKIRQNKNKIKFKSAKGILGIGDPKESKFFMPDWYKNLSSETAEIKPLDQRGTVKRCAPFRDAMQLGYIIPMWSDAEVQKLPNGETAFSFPMLSNFPVTDHPIAQIKDTPFEKFAQNGVFKLHSPWLIETEPGWSCLFISPINHGAKVINIIAGVVDTDTYKQTINFPFLLDPTFEGVIKQGTPIVQVIPFKRGTKDLVIEALTNDDEEKMIAQKYLMHSKMKHGYLKKVRCPFR